MADVANITNRIDARFAGVQQKIETFQKEAEQEKDTLVADPVSGTQQPCYAAKCTLESGGKTYNFVSDATRREFQDQQAAKSQGG